MPVKPLLPIRRPFSAALFAVLFVALSMLSAVAADFASASERRLAAKQGQDDGDEVQFENTELPITHIVFFNTGIAQVIHAGNIADNRSVKLDFPAGTIDDVLKSLVFEDFGGGKVQSVLYQTAFGQEDLAAQQMQPPLTIAQLLQKHRGEQIEITMANSRATGAIFGVENRQLGDELVESVTLLIDGRLQTFAIAAAKSFRFQNEELREQFELAMTGLTRSSQLETKTLELQFAGKGERRVRFAYIVDAPIWRMTWRLDVGDKSAKLQGWAHIDNVTNADWQQVQIDLRSGRARTFHANLFQPILGQRPSIGLSVFGVPPELRVLIDTWRDADLDSTDDDEAPQFYGGFGGGKGRGGGGGFGGGMGGGGFGAGGRGGAGGLPETDETAEMDIQSAFESIADVGRVERMVAIHLKEPVDLEAGKSAMIPVIIDEIDSTLLTVFDDPETRTRPQLIVQIKNATDLAIVPGPAAVYRDGNFVGDAVMPRVDPGDTTELNYGTDQSIAIESKMTGLSKKTTRAEFAGERVAQTQESTSVMAVKFVNKDSKPRDLLLKMNVDGGVFEPQPATTRDGMAHFLYKVEANSETTHPIKRVDTSTEWLYIRKLSPEILTRWQADGTVVAEDLESWLEKLGEISERRQTVELELQDLESVMAKAVSEQERLLKLVAALEPDDAPRERFVGKLAELETVIEEVRPKIADRLKVLSEIRREDERHRESAVKNE